MERLLCDYKNELVRKFNYSDELSCDIAMMAESLADYYGEEYTETVYEALASCKIVKAGLRQNSAVHENVGDVLLKENVEVENIPLKVRKMDRGFFAVPKIIYDNNSFKLVGVDRLIVLPAHYNSLSPESIGILARLCIELVKSSLSSYKIRGNILTSKRGFMTVRENLEYRDGQVLRNEISKVGVSLKNGMDSYDQLCVVRGMYDDTYDVHGEDCERILAGVILETRGIKDELRLCEITHDDAQVKEMFSGIFGRSFEDFLKKTDQLAHFEENRKNSLTDPDQLKLALEKLDGSFNDVALMVSEIYPQVELANAKKI